MNPYKILRDSLSSSAQEIDMNDEKLDNDGDADDSTAVLQEIDELHKLLEGQELRANRDREQFSRQFDDYQEASSSVASPREEPDSFKWVEGLFDFDMEAWKAEEAEMEEVDVGTQAHALREKERNDLSGRLEECRTNIEELQKDLGRLQKSEEQAGRQSWWNWNWFSWIESTDLTEARRQREKIIRLQRIESKKTTTEDLDNALQELEILEDMLKAKEQEILVEHIDYLELLERQVAVREQRLDREIYAPQRAWKGRGRKRSRSVSYDRQAVRSHKKIK